MWKLALTLRGVAGEALLRTYDAERRPIGELTVDQAYARYVNRVAPYLGLETAKPVFDDYTWRSATGTTWRRSSTSAPASGRSTSTRGNRAGGLGRGRRTSSSSARGESSRRSICSGGGLSFSPHPKAARGATRRAAAEVRLELDSYLVGRDFGDCDGRFADAYGLGPAGVVLVRPDDFVGWRSAEAVGNPEETLRRALASLLCLNERKGEP